ncbi:hypothetical protein F511_38702 [Dorcoceras hygrometricum]|uniref:Uncharacterized protein n=1 Tax=Dorcoceras hygrometricum TaxID=472368 RepID=A0A2Z7AXY1_9LAMI|nr:hypothetical protein F511_38702 [Dorcoceras hygrometricum]
MVIKVGGQIWLSQAILDTLVESLVRIAKRRHLGETRFERNQLRCEIWKCESWLVGNWIVVRRRFEKPNLMRAGRYERVHVRRRLVVARWLSVWSRSGVVLRSELVSAIKRKFSLNWYSRCYHADA